MALTVNSLFDRHSLQIQEIINKSITVFQAGIDPVWRDLIVTSQGVGNQSELGRDLKIIKIFMGSFAGVLEQGAPRGNVDLYGDLVQQIGPHMHQQRLTQTYPDPTSGPNASPYRLAVGMRAMPSNMMLTLGEKQMEATEAVIGSVVGPKLMGHARMMSHTLCNYWYLSQNDSYAICLANNVTDYETVTGNGSDVYRFSFEPSNFACMRFGRGMRVDFHETAAVTGPRINDTETALANQDLTTRMECYVETVSPMKNKVTCIAMDDPSDASNGWDGGGGAAYTELEDKPVYYANSAYVSGTDWVFTGIAGVNSWLKPGDANGATASNQNLLLGTAEADSTDRINVNIHPEFMSFLKGVNGVLTEHKLRQYLARCHAAWEHHGHYIDTLIASDGVWTAYEAQKIGQFRIDRTNRTSNVLHEGSQKGFQMSFDGRDYMGYTSHCVESSTLYGIRRGGGNWKKYVPPSPAGARRNPKVDAHVPFEFVGAAIQGGSTNQMPLYATAAAAAGSLTVTLPTEGSQLPGRIRCQMVPDNPAMMKLTGLTEDRQYGDDGS